MSSPCTNGSSGFLLAPACGCTSVSDTGSCCAGAAGWAAAACGTGMKLPGADRGGASGRVLRDRSSAVGRAGPTLCCRASATTTAFAGCEAAVEEKQRRQCGEQRAWQGCKEDVILRLAPSDMFGVTAHHHRPHALVTDNRTSPALCWHVCVKLFFLGGFKDTHCLLELATAGRSFFWGCLRGDGTTRDRTQRLRRDVRGDVWRGTWLWRVGRGSHMRVWWHPHRWIPAIHTSQGARG